jgi:hypothetical protein
MRGWDLSLVTDEVEDNTIHKDNIRDKTYDKARHTTRQDIRQGKTYNKARHTTRQDIRQGKTNDKARHTTRQDIRQDNSRQDKTDTRTHPAFQLQEYIVSRSLTLSGFCWVKIRVRLNLG